MRTAIITGVHGQDGSLLAERLVAEGVRVVGIARRAGSSVPGVDVRVTDITDPTAMNRLVAETQPTECYHLAAAHHSSAVSTARDMRDEILRTNFLSVTVIADAILEHASECRLLYAGSSQMYTAGHSLTIVVKNTSPYLPSTFYGVTKVAGANWISILRRTRGLFGCTAILFNHESERRPPQFITSKVVRAAVTRTQIQIDNIEQRVDWTAARDVVRAMPMILAQPTPRDYIIASGNSHTIRSLVQEAASAAGIPPETIADLSSSPSSLRPPYLLGEIDETTEAIGWKPEISFAELICGMVHAEMQNATEAS